MIESIYWASIFILLYTYLGYLLLLQFLNLSKNKRVAISSSDETPSVAIIIPAWNEAAYLLEKVANTSALTYPTEKLKIVIVTDGSTDGSDDLVKSHSSQFPHHITVLHQSKRSGKAHAMNRAVDYLSGQKDEVEYIVFTDANCLLNKDAIRYLLRPFESPQIALVSGQKKVHNPRGPDGAEQIYWSLESQIKIEEGLFNSVIGAVGELFMIRLDAYPNPEPGIIIEDFYISMKLAMAGQNTAFAAEAIAVENESLSISDEYERKARITAGGFQSLKLLPELLAFWQYPKLFFQVISHRLARWFFSPFAFFLLIISNIFLVLTGGCLFYLISLTLIITAIVLSICNYLLLKSKYPFFNIPVYFLMTQFAQIAGLYRFLVNRQTSLWKKVGRKG